MTARDDLAAMLGPQGAQAMDALLSAFGEAKPPAADAVDPALWRETVERAALAGVFDLRRLTAFAPAPARLVLRSELARVSEAVAVGSRRLHRLSRDLRDGALERLLANPPLLQRRLEAVRLDRNDGAGRELRRLLRGDVPDPARIGRERLDDLLTVAGWLERFGLRPGARAVRLEIARRSLDDGFARMLSDGFVGREDMLARIEAFLTAEPPPGDGVLVIDAIGGAGKSALLACFGREALKAGRERPFFHFDFDRPAIDPRNMGLTLEFTRQLAQLAPEQAEALSGLRARLRATFEQAGGEGGGASAAFRAESELAPALRDIVGQTGLAQTPMVAVMDSFEVVSARGPAAVEAVREWIRFARHGLGAAGLRVIVAGRAAADFADALGGADVAPLQPLPEPEARALLMRLGLKPDAALTVARGLGGNPLALRLAARFLLNQPEVSAAALTEGADAAGDAELAQGLLYRRILSHVGQDDRDPLRRLAYPGLALRVITPGLIRDVVGPTLGLGPLGDDQAAALWARLVDQIWLVRRTGPRVAEHRRDLRQVMARIMARDPAAARAVADLHARAADHHDARRDADLTPEAAAAEAVYHRLMALPPGQDLPPADRPLVARAVGGDFDDLPPHARALAKVHAGPDGPALTIEEAALLPGDLRAGWLVRAGWAAVDAGDLAQALALSVGDEAGRRAPVWLLTALHDAVRWDEAGPAIEQAEADLANGRYTPSPSADPATAPREHPVMAAAAAALLRLQRVETTALRHAPRWREMIATADPGRSGRIPEDRVEAALRLATYHAIAARLDGAGPDAEIWEILDGLTAAHDREGSQPVLARIDAMRWAIGAAPPDQPLRLVGDAVMMTPSALESFATLLGDAGEAERVRAAASALIRGGGDAGSGVLLATFSDRTARLAHPAATPAALREAGLEPWMLAEGAHAEFRGPARFALDAALPDAAALQRLIVALPDVLSAAPPADLRPEPWLRTAADGRGRALAAVVDWAQRAGALDRLLDAAAGVDGAAAEGAGAAAQVAHAVRRWRAAFAMVSSSPIATGR
jgi:hypothetical protein